MRSSPLKCVFIFCCPCDGGGVDTTANFLEDVRSVPRTQSFTVGLP